jgi:homocysteine S-methyltransferase
MSAAEAERYHAHQIEVFAAAAVDMVSAYTLCYVEEAIGIVRAAAATGTPVTIGFTLETDLDSGDPAELAAEYLALEPHLPAIRVLGGCCGTDHRHVARICETWPWTASESR